MFKPSAFVGALFLVCLGFTWPVHAQQAPSPAKAASDTAAIERSQRQSDNVYRWIKYFADQPKKPDANKPRAKTDAPAPAPATARKPELKGPAAETEAASVAATPTQAAPAASAPGDAQQAPSVDALPVVASAAAPAAAEPEATVETAQPLVPVAVVEPTIPRELRNESINTKVRLSFTVQTDGTVGTPSVISGNNRRLNKSAVDALAQWRFEPIRNERTTQIEFQFTQE